MDIDELVTSEGKGSGSNSPAGVRTNTTFHQKPMGQRQHRQSGQSRRRSSSASSSKTTALPPLAPKPPTSGGHVALVRSPTIPEENTSTLRAAPPFSAGPPPPPVPQHEYPSTGAGQFPIGNEPGAQSFDILNPDLDLTQFKTPPGLSGGATNYTDLSVDSIVDSNGTQTDAHARLADLTPFSLARTELRGRAATLSHSLLPQASRVRQPIRFSSTSSSLVQRPP